MVDKGHLAAVDLDPFLLVAGVGGDHLRASSLGHVRGGAAKPAQPIRLRGRPGHYGPADSP